MRLLIFFIKSCFISVLIVCFIFKLSAQETQKTPTPTPTPDVTVENPEEEVLKVSTSLIQTGITVIDKKGQFVNNLKQDDFNLLVDGKPVTVSFFEAVNVLSGSGNKAVRNGEKSEVINNSTENVGRGRTIIFVVDDLHFSFDSHKRTRDLILKFIENEMNPGDLVAVISTSGKVGFLQQFTSDKMVLRAAVDRLIYNRNNSATDRQNPPMSEYEAQLIDRRDPEITDIFAQLVIKDYPGTSMDSARLQVQSRARGILFQGSVITKNTFAVLEQAVRRSAPIAGRKIVFFLSDGFLLDQTNTDSSYRLQRITDAASRANAVIYSFDAKGLEAGFPENTSKSYRVQSGEAFELQDGLSAMADNTGGRFIHNTNDLQTEVGKALVEASGYYLLAWEPNTEDAQNEKLKRIEVSIKNRPELQVRLQNGYLSQLLKKDEPKTNTAPKPPVPIVEAELNTAVTSAVPKRDLPAAMVLNYLDDPDDGAVVAAAIQIKGNAVDFTPESEKETANIDFLGVVYNSEGKRDGYFRERITVSLENTANNKKERPDVFYNYQAKLKPGLYQIRAAFRDVKSGRTGSAVQWIKVPDLSSRRLALSSLLLGERADDKKQTQSETTADSVLAGAAVSVDRSFSRSSNLRYLIFIYNSGRGKSGSDAPDVTVQTQLFRGNNLLLNGQPRQISADGQETNRLFYAAEIPLSSLPAGRYELQLTVQDRTAKSSASQRVSFEVR